MIGEKIQPILKEIEETLLEFEANTSTKPNFPVESLISATKIFSSVLLDIMYDLQDNEKMTLENRCNMAIKAG